MNPDYLSAIFLFFAKDLFSQNILTFIPVFSISQPLSVEFSSAEFGPPLGLKSSSPSICCMLLPGYLASLGLSSLPTELRVGWHIASAQRMLVAVTPRPEWEKSHNGMETLLVAPFPHPPKKGQQGDKALKEAF